MRRSAAGSLVVALALLGPDGPGLGFTGPPAVHAQERGTLFVHADSAEVRLRWNAPRRRAFRGFHVERRPAGGQEWTRLTDEPVRPVREVSRIRELLGPDAAAYLTFFGDTVERIDRELYLEAMSDPVARGMIGLLSVKMPEMARVLGETYADRDLEPGERFLYRAVMVGPEGQERVWAEAPEPVAHGRPETVPVPRELAGEGGERRALLSWAHDSALSRNGELVGYRVYRSETPYGPWQRATFETVVPAAVQGELPEHLFVDRFLENGTPYWYRITGVNVVGAESEPTDPVKVVPRDATPPPAPTGLGGTPRGQAVVLRWSPVESEDLAGYAVYRAREFQGPYQRVTPGEDELPSRAPVHVDEDVSEGGIYWYRVTSVDEGGNESRPSETVQVRLEDRTPPAAPRDVVARGTEAGIRLAWSPNREEDLRGYLVERTTRLERVEADTGASARASDEAAGVDTAAGAGADPDSGAPAAATDTIPRSESGSRGGPPRSSPFYVLHSGPLADSTYVDSVPAVSQTRYAYRVVALDSAWNRSEPSEVVTARMPDHVAPAAPALHGAELEEGRILLRWGRSSEDDLAGYRVRRAPLAAGEEPGGGGAAKATLQPLHPGLLPPDSTAFADRPEEAGARYRYRLTAEDRAGNESEPATVTVRYLDVVAPEPPTGLTLESRPDTLRLTWSPSPSADAETLILYRREGEERQESGAETGGDAESGGDAGNRGELEIRARLPADSTRFDDIRVEEGTRYTYVLKAVDASANVGPASQEASAVFSPPDRQQEENEQENREEDEDAERQNLRDR